MIHYVTGDATDPIGDGRRIIVHCCNNEGGWGKGFVLALSARWPGPEAAYRAMQERKLGTVDLVKVEEDLWVANLIGQDGYAKSYKASNRERYVRYDAIYDGLKHLATNVNRKTDSVHMPRMGAGLAGGNWNIIEAIIESTLCLAGVSVTVYDPPRMSTP